VFRLITDLRVEGSDSLTERKKQKLLPRGRRNLIEGYLVVSECDVGCMTMIH
jgi:hypothetical protein